MKSGLPKTKVLHVRLSEELVKRLDRVAKDLDRSRAYVIQTALLSWAASVEARKS